MSSVTSSVEVFSNLNPAQLVSRATDFIIKPDWDINLYIAERLNQKPEWVKPVLAEVEKKLRDEDRQVAVFAVTLLDTCLKNSYTIIERASSRDFTSTLVKLATDNKTPYELQTAIVDNLASWAISFSPLGLIGFQEALNAIRSKGVKVPANPVPFDPPKPPGFELPPSFTPFAPQTQQYPGQGHPQHAAAAPAPTGPITQNEVKEIRDRLDLLFDIFGAFDPRQEDITRNDIVAELYPSCVAFQSRVVSHLENGTVAESLLEQLLLLNDDLIRAKDTYEGLAKGKPAAQPHPQPQAHAPQPAPKQTNSSNFSLFDLDSHAPTILTNNSTAPVPAPDVSQLSLNEKKENTEAPSEFIPFLPAPPGAGKRKAGPPTQQVQAPPAQVKQQPVVYAQSYAQPPVGYYAPPPQQPVVHYQPPAATQPKAPIEDDLFGDLLRPKQNAQPVTHQTQTLPAANNLITPTPAPLIQPQPHPTEKKDDFLNFLLQ